MLLKLLLDLLLSNRSLLILSVFYVLRLLLTGQEVFLEMLLEDFGLPIIRFSQASLVPFILNIVSTHVLAELADLIIRKEAGLVKRLLCWVKLIFNV